MAAATNNASVLEIGLAIRIDCKEALVYVADLEIP
jgi:hypothetical protein